METFILEEGFGGAERDRTAGLLVANEALSQLSYSPTPSDFYILPAILRSAQPDPGVVKPCRRAVFPARAVWAATFVEQRGI